MAANLETSLLLGGEIIFPGGNTPLGTAGIPGTIAGCTTPLVAATDIATIPGTGTPPATGGTIPDIIPAVPTPGIVPTPGTPGIPEELTGIAPGGITLPGKTIPAVPAALIGICTGNPDGGIPETTPVVIVAGKACGNTPGNVPGTIPGTAGTAPGNVAPEIGTLGDTPGIIGGLTLADIDFNGSRGLKLPVAVGVIVDVHPTVDSEASNVGGKTFGRSIPRSFKLINLHAILNSLMFIFPSESVSARALKY